jgi:hypothetical protein
VARAAVDVLALLATEVAARQVLMSKYLHLNGHAHARVSRPGIRFVHVVGCCHVIVFM